jgi:hypothetical protein
MIDIPHGWADHMITREDYLHFAVRALRGMAEIVVDLGDDLANRRPRVEGANSPFVVLTHCLGVVDYWVGELVAGRPAHRDRAAEFRAHGPVAPLVQRVEATIGQLAADVAVARPDAPPHGPAPTDLLGPDRSLDQSGALQHAYEELAQHYGQMEILRDWIRADPGATDSG